MSSILNNNDKGWYIGISLMSILLIIFLFAIFYISYKNNSRFFAPFDPSSNIYIVSPGQNGLQYINLPSGVDAFINSNSSAASQKQNMIQKALSSLETNGTSEGYIETESTNASNNYSVYILLIFILIILIGCLITYATFNESKGV